jgi:uncharacterized metal-binding protein YceD (DUF177 family)
MTPELSRLFPADRVDDTPVSVEVTADANECAALARRLQIPAVSTLHCAFRLTRLSPAVILAEAQLDAEVIQTCVISLDDFAARIDESFRLRFVPEGTESDNPDPEDDDEIGYSGVVLDLGEAAAQQLALALDPYPRAPGAELPLMEEQAAAHPFAALRAVRRSPTH